MANQHGSDSVFTRTATGVLDHLATTSGLPTWLLVRSANGVSQVLASVDPTGHIRPHQAVGHDVGDGSAARLAVPVMLPDGDLFGEVIGFGALPLTVSQSEALRTHADVLATALGALASSSRMLAQLQQADPGAGDPADPLTGLATRQQWEHRLRSNELFCAEFGEPAGVFVVELDDLKRSNELHGYSAGDAQLRKVGAVVRQLIGDRHFAARLTGDRLGIALIGAPDHEMADFERSLRRGFAAIDISTAIGVGRRHPDRGLDGAVDDAESQLDRGTPAPRPTTTGDAHEAAAVIEAIELGAIRAYFQPIVELRTGAVVAIEALARWQSRDGIREPDQFLRLVQQAGLLGALFERVLDDGLQRLAEYRHLVPGLSLAVNFEFDSKLDNTFHRTVTTLLAKHRVPAQSLSIELSERQTFDLPSAIRRELLSVADMGVRLVLDDFGTGFASLETLTSLPVSGVKLDRRFTGQVVNGEREAVVVKAIIAMATEAGLDVIAEGIETQQQCDRLVRMGCRLGQGYLFALPQPADSLAAVLSAPLVTNF
jgi:diguanylate cyclase (GGDEF)-like protein